MIAAATQLNDKAMKAEQEMDTTKMGTTMGAKTSAVDSITRPDSSAPIFYRHIECMQPFHWNTSTVVASCSAPDEVVLDGHNIDPLSIVDRIEGFGALSPEQREEVHRKITEWKEERQMDYTTLQQQQDMQQMIMFMHNQIQHQQHMIAQYQQMQQQQQHMYQQQQQQQHGPSHQPHLYPLSMPLPPSAVPLSTPATSSATHGHHHATGMSMSSTTAPTGSMANVATVSGGLAGGGSIPNTPQLLPSSMHRRASVCSIREGSTNYRESGLSTPGSGVSGGSITGLGGLQGLSLASPVGAPRHMHGHGHGHGHARGHGQSQGGHVRHKSRSHNVSPLHASSRPHVRGGSGSALVATSSSSASVSAGASPAAASTTATPATPSYLSGGWISSTSVASSSNPTSRNRSGASSTGKVTPKRKSPGSSGHGQFAAAKAVQISPILVGQVATSGPGHVMQSGAGSRARLVQDDAGSPDTPPDTLPRRPSVKRARSGSASHFSTEQATWAMGVVADTNVKGSSTAASSGGTRKRAASSSSSVTDPQSYRKISSADETTHHSTSSTRHRNQSTSSKSKSGGGSGATSRARSMEGGGGGGGRTEAVTPAASSSSLDVDTESAAATSSVRPRRRRAKKDPTAPKRPASAYMMWCLQRRPQLKKLHPDVNSNVLMRRMALEWRAQAKTVEFMSEWNELHRQDQIRYRKQMEEWRGTGSFTEHKRRGA